MRDRHLPRLCHVCRAPMARQEDRCWRCGTQWAATEQSRPRLQVLIGGGTRTSPPPDREASEMRSDTDRWLDEGGGLTAVAAEASLRLVR
jgi:hypothetical protein